MDDLPSFWESHSITGCTDCKFSNGGQMFAAIWNSSIMVCNTWSFEVVANLKLHSNKLLNIAWANDDTKIISYAQNGNITVWDLDTKSKEYEVVMHDDVKNINYTCVALSKDARSLFASCSNESLEVLNSLY